MFETIVRPATEMHANWPYIDVYESEMDELGQLFVARATVHVVHAWQGAVAQR